MSDKQSPMQRSDAELARLEGKLRIDKHALDEEEMDQARYYNECAQLHADAISYRDEAKAEVEGTYAMLDQEFRLAAEQEGKKPTDTAVKSKITTHPAYQKALVKHAAWTDRAYRWGAVVEAVKSRGYALQDLAKLYVGGYWTGSSVPSKDQREAKSQRVEQIKEELAEKNRPRRERLKED